MRILILVSMVLSGVTVAKPRIPQAGELIRAVLAEDVKTVTRILAITNTRGANTIAFGGREQPILALAVETGNMELTRIIFRYKARIDTVDAIGQSALIRAAAAGKREPVAYLIRKGANIDLRDDNNWTALYPAVEALHLDVTQELIDAGLSPNLRDLWHRTAIYRLLEPHRDPDMRAKVKAMISYLVDVGAWLNVHDNHGLTPLHVAVQRGLDREIIAHLVKSGADMKVVNNAGNTPLATAIELHKFGLARSLIEIGANLHRKNKYGIAPIDQLWAVLPRPQH